MALSSPSTIVDDVPPAQGLSFALSRIASRFDYLMSIAILLLGLTAAPTTVAAAAAQTLPYIPTTILIPESNTVPLQQNATPGIAYIFSPNDDTVELLALNISASLKASSVSLQTLSDLPFLADNANTAFSASLADNGSIVVYAGDCSSASDSSIWTFSPSSHVAASSAWVQQDTAEETDIEAEVNQTGPGFLGGSLSFSTTLEPDMSKASVYVYGGMCPNRSVEADTTQANATYSNHMLRIAPSESDASDYVVSPVASKGPPVPEAGFTLTGLSPSIANRSGVVTQQVNYVLLGGHTRNAFINMSTVALWSLPEESWGFVSEIGVTTSSSSSSSSTNTELAIKSTYDIIESRSGHTAVLNEDGSALIVLGGWVGDLTQAASPQLAILEIGAGYGGDGDWQWSVPETQPSGPGLYGHGAALLPGNVMMVYGGYSIESSGSGTKTKRQAATAAGGGNVPMFLNLTSLAWSDDYTNPSSTQDTGSGSGSGNGQTPSTPDQEEEAEEEDRKKRLGFGLGLGLGLAAILAAILVYLWYRRRLRLHRRTIRNSALQALAQDTSHFIHDDDEMAERAHDENAGAFPWYAGGPDPWGRAGGGGSSGRGGPGYQSLRSGGGRGGGSIGSWHHHSGSGPHARRKPGVPRAAVGARGQYQPTPTGSYDSPPRGPGPIHPIYEADEETSIHDGDIAREPLSPVRDGDGGEGEKGEKYHDRDSAQYSDPFATPTQERSPISFPPPVVGGGRASATPSPDRQYYAVASTTDPEVQDWMTDIDAADALLSGRVAASSNTTSQQQQQQQHGSGRPSPTRRNTDKSARSLSAIFGGGGSAGDDESRTGSNISESNRSNLTPSRSDSVRSALAALRSPIGFGVPATTAAGEGRGGTAGSGSDGGNSNSNNSTSSSSAAPSYNTARSSFHALQAEGPALLLGGSGNRDRDRDREREREREREMRGGADEEEDYYGNMPGSPSKSKPRRGWLGSLRRVFSGPTPSPSPPGSHGDGSPRRESFLATEANDFDVARLGGLGSIAAGGLLRRKGGRGAWESGGGGSGSGEGSHMMTGGLSGGGASTSRGRGNGGEEEDEWDIEKAIERRLVQVMFTVPKERLRVVNAEPEIDDALSGVLVNPGDEDEDEDEEDDDEDQDEGGANINDEKRGLVVPTTPPPPPRLQINTREAIGDKGGHHRQLEQTRILPPTVDNPEKEALRRDFEGGIHEERDIASMSRSRSREKEEEDERKIEDDIWDDNDDDDSSGRGGGGQRKKNKHKKRASRLSALEQEIDLLGAELEAQRDRHASAGSGVSGLSGVASTNEDNNNNHSDGDVFSAEAVRFEKPTPTTLTPRTRVLQMVESFESLGREDHNRSPVAGSPSLSHSPSRSPTRTPVVPLKGR